MNEVRLLRLGIEADVQFAGKGPALFELAN